MLTFGLRGSVNYDNASVAIDAANSILTKLKTINIEAAVGMHSSISLHINIIYNRYITIYHYYNIYTYTNTIIYFLFDTTTIIKIGITSGPVYCGIVGSVERHEYSVMGSAVNLSARLAGTLFLLY